MNRKTGKLSRSTGTRTFFAAEHVDGAGVPMPVAALEDSAGTRGATLLRLCEMVSDPKPGKAATVRGSVTQSAAVGSATAAEHGTSVFDARRIVIVSDGAPWIENTADRVFGRRNPTYILDQFRSLEHLRAAVRAMEPDPAQDVRRRERLTSLILAGKVEPVIREASRHAKRHEEVSKRVGYFRGDLHRLHHGECRAKGMPVGSGAIEGVCKSVICGRMKLGSDRWLLDGVDNTMALKCCSLNNQVTDVLEWRRAA